MDGIAKILDVVFNGREAEPVVARKTVTIQDLIDHGKVSTVRVGKKFYRVTVEEVEISRLRRKK